MKEDFWVVWSDENCEQSETVLYFHRIHLSGGLIFSWDESEMVESERQAEQNRLKDATFCELAKQHKSSEL